MFVSCFVVTVIRMDSFWSCSRLDDEESVDCCALLFFLVPCVGLQCVIVVYPDHINFLLVFLSHIIAMVSPFQPVGNTITN